MGREACWRHDIAYLVSWRRVTHLQRSWRWGNASRPRAICATNPFRYRSELCIHWPCRQNSAHNHETPTLVTDSVARPPPPRAGRAARRFGAPLTPRLARRPLCGGRRSAVGGRRTAVGGRPVRRGALRCGQIQFHRARGRLLSGTGPLVVIFSLTQNIDKNRPPWRNKGV